MCLVTSTAVVACDVTEPLPPSAARGAASREALVDAFLTAVAASDTQALIALTDRVVDARSDVAALLRSSEGVRLAEPMIGWQDEFGGVYVVVTVTGANAATGASATLTVPISRKAGRFYLALGSANLGGSDSLISSPVPPSP
jgi:hypothetical protein